MTETEIKLLVQLASETMQTCRVIIKALTEKDNDPKLIGVVQASEMVNRSRVWLRRKLELGELTGYQTGRGGNWQLDPELLIRELKEHGNCRKVPVKRRKKSIDN